MKSYFNVIGITAGRGGGSKSYYVSNSGNDSLDGLTPATAWQTISKVNNSTFDPGNRILFNKGDTWRETLTVPSSGSIGRYITFGAYGAGDKPKLLGSEEETDWTQIEVQGVAANNDLLTESFEGVGYENAWAETIGANAGCIVDENNTDVVAPSGGGSQVLKIVKVPTPTATGTASAARARYTFTNEQNVYFADFYVMINAHGLTSNTDQVRLWWGTSTAGDITQMVGIYRNVSNEIRLMMQTYTNGGYSVQYYPSSGNITLDQWYHVQVMWDINNHLFSTCVDDTILIESSLTGTHASGLKFVSLGENVNAKAITAYIDMVNLSSTNFGLAEVLTPTNVWKSVSHFSDPYSLQDDANIYFKETDESITWGRVRKALQADLVAEYDWTWLLNHIYVYAATTPATRYSGVEITQRENVILLNGKECLTFDGLELAFGGRANMKESFPQTNVSGLTIKNCHTHHIGIKASNSGFGFSVSHSNMLIKDNIIHDTGRRGISINLNFDVIQVSNVIIEKNTFYHGFHTTGLDIATTGDGTIDNIIVRKNLIYDDITEVLDQVESYKSNGIFAAATAGGKITNLYIYDNVIKNTTIRAIHFLIGVESSYIWNNTIVGVNPNLIEEYIAMIYLQGDSNAVLKNNIVYSNVDHAVNANYWTLWFGSTGTLVSDYNLFYNTDALSRMLHLGSGLDYLITDWEAYKTANGQDANSPAPADPKFVSSSDFHLQSDSPCINAGVVVGLTEDYEGNPIVGVPDIGAYEYQP